MHFESNNSYCSENEYVSNSDQNGSNINYSSNNYDSVREFQVKRQNRLDTEENNYNSIRGAYTSSYSIKNDD
jgi:hypothetical protein